MDVVTTLDVIKNWPQYDAAQKLMQVIGGESSRPTSLFVGGAVRNALLSEAVYDIDIATCFTPQMVVEKCAGFKVIPTGIDHGTVTVVVEGIPFEVTTLRHDIETNGRHAEVAFTDDWVADAKRRDFTINTLLCDINGSVYDPLDCGVDDLKACKVIFVGEPSKRIEEDYLRILRFFRFYAFYGDGAPNKDALLACAQHANKIKSLSRERITQELLKILIAPKASNALAVMFDNDILKDIGQGFDADLFENLEALQDKYDAPNLMARLFIVAGCQVKFFDDYLRLSHAQKNELIKLEMAARQVTYDDEKELKKAIYHHGNDLLFDGYILKIATAQVKEEASVFGILKNWQAPKFHLNGQDLIAEGYVTGPDLGIELKRREEEWLEETL